MMQHVPCPEPLCSLTFVSDNRQHITEWLGKHKCMSYTGEPLDLCGNKERVE